MWKTLSCSLSANFFTRSNSALLPFWTRKAKKSHLQNIEKQLTDINHRLQRTYELLEDGVYSKETFLQRQSAISQDQTALLNTKHEIERKLHNKQTDIEAQKNSAPLIRHVLDVYPTLEDPKEQNLFFLKQVIRRRDYTYDRPRLTAKPKSDLQSDNPPLKLL